MIGANQFFTCLALISSLFLGAVSGFVPILRSNFHGTIPTARQHVVRCDSSRSDSGLFPLTSDLTHQNQWTNARAGNGKPILSGGACTHGGGWSTNYNRFLYDITAVAKRAAIALRREIDMTLGMIESDVPVTVVLGTVSMAAYGFAGAPLSIVEWATAISKSVVWFFLYIYQFNIGNQMSGVEEDRLNLKNVACKANRPLATGAMSMEEGAIRHKISSCLYMAASWIMGGPQLTLWAGMWIATSHLLNKSKWGGHFAIKNYFGMASGSTTMLLGARTIAGATGSSSMIPAVLTATWIGLCMDSQDLRDEEGDRLTGRSTTSVLLGLEGARKAYVALASGATSALLFVMRGCLGWADAVIAMGVVAHLIRTLGNQTVEDDNKTYKEICLAGFCFFFRSAFWAQLA